MLEEYSRYGEIMKIKIVIYLILIATLFSCQSLPESESKITDSTEFIKEEYSIIPIPEREHGYSYLENTVISSSTELDMFIDKIELQDAWNNKEDVISVLKNENIDFDIYSIFIYRHEEGSSADQAIPELPVLTDNSEKILIRINRLVYDGPKTTDMAYYAFAYKIRKEIKAVIFQIDDETIAIENK